MEESPLKQSDAVLQWIADIQRQREHAETLRQLQAWGAEQCHWALAPSPNPSP